MEYKGKKIAVCFTSVPSDGRTFASCETYLFGENEDLHEKMMIGSLFGNKYHRRDDYTQNIVWFKYLDDDSGLFGVDESELKDLMEEFHGREI